METRPTMFTLLGYKDFYDQDKTVKDAIQLIRGIPSSTLLNYISGASVNIYLNDKVDIAGKVQTWLLSSLTSKNRELELKCQEIIKKWIEEGHSPMIFYVHSNLLFYNVIFKEYNSQELRDVNSDEAKRFFDAYLIINSIVNQRIMIDSSQFVDDDPKQIEAIFLSNFIHQRDYQSNLDFGNQVVRGYHFFEYLENHAKYKTILQRYYSALCIPGYMRLFKNLMVIFQEIGLEQNNKPRNQIINIYRHFNDGSVDLSYFENLSINKHIKDYKEDFSFEVIRNHPLYKIDTYRYYLLDINFFIDQFYKGQVFHFHNFLKEGMVTNEFLSEKAKEFMEERLIPIIIQSCFPDSILFFGNNAKNSKGNELCDIYIRQEKNIALIEFKDILLSADAKNSANVEKLFSEFDKKFWQNQSKKPKGILQLLNAIKDVNDHGVQVETIAKDEVSLFPIIVYTDFSFGIEGLNKFYKGRFNTELGSCIKNMNVHEVTFINLNYFEVMQDYLAKKEVDLFTIIRQYHLYTADDNYSRVSFEVFARHYMNENVSTELGGSSFFKELLPNIINA